MRDIYAAGVGQLLLVATDNLSAFDVVLPTQIPGKGEILTRLSVHWFRSLAGASPHHLLSADPEDFPEPFRAYASRLRGRSMLVRRAHRLDVECVVRGRLTGSGLKDYRATGRVCGQVLEAGLGEGAVLDPPLFTPAAKNDLGHDRNCTFEEVQQQFGALLAARLRERSLAQFLEARARARERGLELVDTKFEFGMVEDTLTLIDELVTPDSSRFWELDQSGNPRAAFDKQFVRDYLETLPWDKTAPGPELPPEMVERTRALYRTALERLAGEST